jgi:uncharacterized protein YbaR (Trm112 family)
VDDAFLAQLRCPLDPARQATLARDQQSLVCSGCHARFPVKQGLPVLISEEAELPPGVSRREQLPCVRAANPRRGHRN